MKTIFIERAIGLKNRALNDRKSIFDENPACLRKIFVLFSWKYEPLITVERFEGNLELGRKIYSK